MRVVAKAAVSEEYRGLGWGAGRDREMSTSH